MRTVIIYYTMDPQTRRYKLLERVYRLRHVKDSLGVLQKAGNKYTNLYPDAIWATMALYYDEFTHYEKSTGKNWYSGDKISDLVENVEADKQVKIEGETHDDSNYTDDMYSDEQLKRQKDMDNIFKVDNIPSRWEHNKTRSQYH